MAGDYASPGQYQSPGYPPAKPADQTNVPGLIGFILALVSFISCGALAPVALILSIIGMRKEPKGLAIAGLIISILGMIELLIFGIYFATVGVMFASCLGLAAVGAQEAAKQQVTKEALRQAEMQIEGHRDLTGSLPDDVSGNQQIEGLSDGWGKKLRYTRQDEESYELVSAGPDGLFDTFDDKTLDDLDWPSNEAYDAEPSDAMESDLSVDDGIKLDAAPLDGTSDSPFPAPDSALPAPDGAVPAPEPALDGALPPPSLPPPESGAS
jgi:hypothetical protein